MAILKLYDPVSTLYSRVLILLKLTVYKLIKFGILEG